MADYEIATAGAPGAPVRGLPRITAPVQSSRRHITPIVARFLDAEHGVEVELLLSDRNIDLIEEGIDVALRIGPLADSSLSARSVGQVRRLWVASPAYLKRRGTPSTPADLVRHGCAATPTGPSPAPGAARRPGWRGGCGSTMSRRGSGWRATEAASPSSCPIRWPTISRPAGLCACCRPGNARRCWCIF
jgi:DNA-binding transcriptional LysR family regulator